MTSGTNKLSLTTTKGKQFNDALRNKKGIQVTLSTAAIKNMIKTGGIFPFAAAQPALAPFSGSLGSFVIDNIMGRGLKGGR